MQATDLLLARLRFTSKIDFITLSNHHGRIVALPPLDGIVKWSRRHHYRQFSIHNPSPDDIAKLMAAFGRDTPILEMEVSSDLAAAKAPDLPLLREVMVELFGKRLCPSAPSLAGYRRRAWRPHLSRLVSLGASPFMPEDQYLLGSRRDAVQVKCYLKRTDQGRRLDDREAVARVEVRLGAEELSRIGLWSLIRLDGFRFRKHLMPYFRHCTPASRRKRGEAPTRRRNETAINDRIGQALLRLERQHRGMQWNDELWISSTGSHKNTRFTSSFA